MNPGLVANLGKKMEVEQPFWSQVLVEAVFPDQHWHLVQVAVCIGDDTAPPPLRIRPGKLYVKDCPICGQRFETRCSYRKYHPRLSRREIDRWRRQQKKLES